MNALLAFVVALGVLSLLVALRSLVASARSPLDAQHMPRLGSEAPEAGLPEVTLIVPCCGDEEGLEANLEALFGQRYPRFRIRLVVERRDDGAVSLIERVRERYPDRSALVFAGPARGRGQKVHNLLAALDVAPPSDVLAFADSDGRPEPTWLRQLVAPLGEPQVGVASSYRFYRPRPAGLATLLRSTWNLSVALLGDRDRNFAWGGSMAIRREVFERAGVRPAWLGAVSDDYALTHAIRRAGLRVAFVPGCLVGSEGAIGVRELLAWSARQISITRVYWPAVFRLAAASNLCSTSFLVLAPLVGGAFPLALVASVLLLSGTSGGLRALALGRLAPRWRRDTRRFLWAYVVMAPLASFVTAAGVVRALVSRRIEWRGRMYEMRSPSETVILEA